MDIIEYSTYFQYNSLVILSYFFICLLTLFLNKLTKDRLNKLFFSSYRSSLFNPLTYIRMVGHIFGHSDWSHFMNNFMIILLIGPMIEEKYGSINLLIMIGITAVVTAIINMIISNKAILGASGIAFMLIILSSLVNFDNGKIPITLILICLFYIVNEIYSGILKKDNVSHLSHIIGAVCGGVLGIFYF